MDTQETFTTQSEDGLDTGQKVMIGIVALVVVVGGYLVFRPSPQEGAEQITGEASRQASIATVIDGEHVYSLGGLEWVFEPQAEDEAGAVATRVRLRLKDFERDGRPIDVALYRLGTYRGTCQSLEQMPKAFVPPEKDALAFAQCWFAGAGRQLMVFQSGDVLLIKIRMIAEEDERLEPLSTILSIDLTKIIQSEL